MPFSVVIIGLGGIGMGYDIRDKSKILSHAKAFHLHPDFEVIAAIDPSEKARAVYTQIYSAPTFASISALRSLSDIDVVVVASPTETHLSVIDQTLKYCSPRMVLCEKPLAYTLKDAKSIFELCDATNTLLLVNYIRRADPAVLDVRSMINSNSIALPFKAMVWYTKGLLHSGSHLFDLLSFWFDPPEKITLIKQGGAQLKHDGEPDFLVEFESGTAIFCAAKEENFALYTIDVVARNGRLRYEQEGSIYWTEALGQQDDFGHRFLSKTSLCLNGDMTNYQYNVAGQLSAHLFGAGHTLCDGEQAVRIISSLEPLIRAG